MNFNLSLFELLILYNPTQNFANSLKKARSAIQKAWRRYCLAFWVDEEILNMKFGSSTEPWAKAWGGAKIHLAKRRHAIILACKVRPVFILSADQVGTHIKSCWWNIKGGRLKEDFLGGRAFSLTQPQNMKNSAQNYDFIAMSNRCKHAATKSPSKWNQVPFPSEKPLFAF